MHEESTVSLKVYLKEGNNNLEVRRFEVDHGVITNYDYVRERLQMAIPKLRERQYKLLWQDSDGDEVTISSDEELMIALSELKSSVLKFIVRMPSENSSDPEAHISIAIPSLHDMYSSATSWAEKCPLFAELQSEQNCHACQKPIAGFRYRCLECLQYYLCGDCEHKNVHPDHVMLRLSKNPSISNLVSKGVQIAKSHFIGGLRCPGMAFRERMSHCHKKDKDDEKDKGKHGHGHFKKYRKHGHHGDKHGNESAEECPFNPQAFGNLGDLVGAFLDIYREPQNKPQENQRSEPAAGPSTATPAKTVDLPSGPPMPSSPAEEDMEHEPTAPSGNNDQKDTKIKMAVELLSEMGFNDDNKWLSRLLEHFDGDIAKTIDHLTLGK